MTNNQLAQVKYSKSYIISSCFSLETLKTSSYKGLCLPEGHPYISEVGNRFGKGLFYLPSSLANISRSKLPSPRVTSAAFARLKYKCMSLSTVKPIPP